MEHPPFYGEKISRLQQQEVIHEILKKYKGQTVDDKLREKVYNELMDKKYEGIITIPFELKMYVDPNSKFPSYLDVLLDTRV